MEFSITILLSCFLLLVAAYLKLKKKNLPPGPYCLPFVGYQPFLHTNFVKQLTNLKKKYGSLVRISLGMNNVVILNDWQAMKEALVTQGMTFNGRADLFWQKKVFTEKGIAFANEITWKEQRKFTMHILRDFGFGRSSMENVIMFEVDKVAEYLNENAGKPIEITKIFALPILNILWNVMAGKRFEEMDEFVKHFFDFLHHAPIPPFCNIVNSFPVLRFILPNYMARYRIFEKMIYELEHYLEKEVADHETNFKKDNLKDFIDVYLAEIYKRREKIGDDNLPYDREHLASTVMDLLMAGEDTIDTTLCWAFLYMANYPNIQRKVQDELDTIVARESFLSMSSKSLAPYTEATLMEVQRDPGLVALPIPRISSKDTTLLGYDIPKGTILFPNIYAVQHDELYWGDPDTFRPERFLDDTGKNIIKHECYIPFNVGPRTCMGDNIARMELHLFFTSLMRRFTFEVIPGEEKPSMEPMWEMLVKPRPFSLIVKPR